MALKLVTFIHDGQKKAVRTPEEAMPYLLSSNDVINLKWEEITTLAQYESFKHSPLLSIEELKGLKGYVHGST